jgi:plastocyanin
MLAKEATTKTALLLVAAVALSSCGEPSPRAERSPPPPAPSPTDEPSPTPTRTGEAKCLDATVRGPVVRLRQEDDFFRPSCLVALGGQFLRISNGGTRTHNFTVAGTDLDVDVDASSHLTTEVIGGVVPAGTHRFFCKYHQDVGMEGEITISAAG